MYLDEPITTETTHSGRPIAFTTRGSGDRYRVRRILSTFQAAGDARLYRLHVDAPTGPAVADVVGPRTTRDGAGESEEDAAWRLRRIWG